MVVADIVHYQIVAVEECIEKGALSGAGHAEHYGYLLVAQNPAAFEVTSESFTRLVELPKDGTLVNLFHDVGRYFRGHGCSKFFLKLY